MAGLLDIQKVIDRIKHYKDLRSEKDVAPLLGLTAADFSNRKKRGSLIPLIVEWALQEDFDLNYLFLGKDGREETNSERKTLSQNIRYIHTMTGQKGPDNWLSDMPVDELILSDEFGKDVILIKMTGSSMEPIIREGAIYAVDNSVASFSSGQIFVVWIPLDGPVVRRVFIDFEKLILKADNHAYPEMIIPITEIPKDNFILGKVLWVLQSI